VFKVTPPYGVTLNTIHNGKKCKITDHADIFQMYPFKEDKAAAYFNMKETTTVGPQ
jgi:hypothetical protein